MTAGRFALRCLVLLAMLASWWLAFDIGGVPEPARLIAATVTLLAGIIFIRRLIGGRGRWWVGADAARSPCGRDAVRESMIRRSTRYLTSGERAANRVLNPFHILLLTDTWQERKEGFVEVLEFSVDKAWLVPGCDRGPGCCPGCLLLRTPSREFICLAGTVWSAPAYDFRWASTYKSGRCDGDHAVVERWPKTGQIYSVRFSGGPVEHVSLDDWDVTAWGQLGGPCDIIEDERLNNLPEHENH